MESLRRVRLKFDDDSKLYFFQGDLVGIVLKTTVRPTAILGGNACACTILGKGKILHYGGSPDHEPPTYDISCNSAQTQS